MTDERLLPLRPGALAAITGLPVPAYDRSGLRKGIAHFGVGNFHRAHQAVYIDRYLSQGGSRAWGIVGIGTGASEAASNKARHFAEQGCLYTLTELDPSGASSTRVLGPMVDYLHAPSSSERVLELLSSPELHIVTMSITEGGYFTDPQTGEFLADHPDVRDDCSRPVPRTVFGYIVRALERRRRQGLAPFTVVSCDNLPHNGQVARAAVVGFARIVDPALAAWLEERGAFPSSMVDRVVPYVDDGARAELNRRSGVDDKLAVMAESYLQWVLEDSFCDGRPELETVGVQVVQDISSYETAKLRLLNAPHVLLSYPGVLAGHRVVNRAVAEPALHDLLEKFMTDDVLPLLEGSLPEDLVPAEYIASVLERFANPSVQDQLLRIATDGASKIPTFHTEVLRGLVRSGADLRREALLLACYHRYLGGRDDHGEPFEVTEPSLSPAELDRLRGGPPADVLAHPKFAGLRAAGGPEFERAYRDAAEVLSRSGVRESVRAVLV